MVKDRDVTPKLGRIRARSGEVSHGRAYLNKVIKTTNLARGGGAMKPVVSRFTGSRISRGKGVASVLTTRAGVASFRQRRVVVKSRIVRLAGKGRATAAAHMRYIQRDGVTKEGLKGELYNARDDRADGREFFSRSEGDRHQFRFIVSPEDGVQYDNLKSVTRRLLSSMEQDLGTKLDWVAVDHFNTGHPHTHVLIRGKDDQGKDLIIAPEYITSGVRERAIEIVSLDLGPRTQREIDASLQAEVTQERFTSIDRELLRRQNDQGLVRPIDNNTFRHSLLAGRLHTLGRLGLAQQTGPSEWQLRDDMQPVLRRLGERGDIIKQLAHDMKALGRDDVLADFLVHDQDPAKRTDENVPPRLTGALIRRGLSDELNDRHYVVIDGLDGRVHVIDIGQGDRTPFIEPNSILTIEARVPSIRPSDITITKVASHSDGFYNVANHLAFDESASVDFAEAHQRRLLAIERVTKNIEKTPAGSFKIGKDYLDAALAYEKRLVSDTPARIDVETSIALDKQPVHNGPTWLDKRLLSGEGVEEPANGFGAAVANALKQRQQWLIEEGLAEYGPDGSVVYGRDMTQKLAQRQLNQVAVQLSEDLGLAYRPSQQSERVEGRLSRMITSADTKYAVVERSKEFSLVPWRKELEREIGKQVSGIDRGSGIQWETGRNKGIGR